VSALEVVASVFLLGGVFLALVAGFGLLRFPDLFSRMHAATKPATLGMLLVVVGGVLLMQDRSHDAKLLLVAAFQFLTAPVAAHMIGRAAYGAGAGALDDLVIDELREAGGRPDPPGYPDTSGPASASSS
jgi:multicomponent Na+:H+ antiporter subunit G